MVACWIDKALRKIFFTAHLTHEPGIIEGKIEGEKGRGEIKKKERKNEKERKTHSEHSDKNLAIKDLETQEESDQG
jgi:hypothetical protein